MSYIFIVLLYYIAILWLKPVHGDQKKQMSVFEYCMEEILKPKYTSETEIEFYKTSFDESVDRRSPLECMAGIANRKEINDVSNLINHLYVKGCLKDVQFLKNMLRQENCSHSIMQFSNTLLISYVYFANTIEERNFTTFAYSCCKPRFKPESTARTSSQRMAIDNYMHYLVKQKMIESVGKTVESLLAKWRAKGSHLQSITSQGKTTPGSIATTWPLLNPANYTIGL